MKEELYHIALDDYEHGVVIRSLNDKKTDLKTEIGLSSTTIAKLSKGESVTTDTILRICERFDVQPGDIMEYVPDEDQS